MPGARYKTMKIAIVGAGKLGLQVAYALLEGNHSVTVIDKNAETLQKISSQLDVMTVAANGKDISVLKRIHIASFDYLIATTDRDEKNIVISSFAKKLGCSRVIARVRDPEHVNQYDFIRDTMSIDYLVNPDMAITQEIYKYLVEKYTLSNGIFSAGKAALLEFKANRIPTIVGRKVSEFNEFMPDMLVAAISRNGHVIIPHGIDEIEENDSIYIIGKKSAMMDLNKQVHERGKYTNLQKVMIVGGGKTGFFLAQKLSEFGVSVKVVERSKDRCVFLSERLKNVMVLNGDGTDLRLLEDENLDDMDAFVTCTGYDEDNLLLALMAKNHGVEDVIAKVSRGIYTDMVSMLGVDMALSPLDITVSNILRIIQGSKSIVTSQLIQGQAELLEIYVNEHMKLTGKPIHSLNLPQGVLIGAIHRGSDILIPDGDTIIKDGDRVIIMALLSEVPDLERIMRTGGPADFLR